MKLQMVDLHGQYLKIKNEVDAGISQVIESSAFINGPQVKEFAGKLADYVHCKHVITCGNGTDALQIALMALDLKPGDEVIVLTPVMVDVDYNTFNVTLKNIEKALSPKTKAIIPVHLFGQSCDMAPIMEFANKHKLYVVEDNAQAIGARYTFPDGSAKFTGTIGHIGCTSFFPSKNLGCYGDGGAIFTDDDVLGERLKMIANHGQQVKYHHKVIGCNSRLDTIQAVVLNAKLPHLDEYCRARYAAAQYYTSALKGIDGVITPVEQPNSSHVYHQYTLKVLNGKRDALKQYLADNWIPSMIYYPLPLQQQEAFGNITRAAESLDTAAELAASVLSLPIHTEISHEQQDMVIDAIKSFFK